MESIFWLAASILLFVLEACTVTLICIWFAIGAAAAFIVSLFDVSVWWCLGVFIAVSALTLIFTRKYALKFMHRKNVATNADALIGKPAIVTQEIDNIKTTGEVMINGQIWKASARIGEIIKKGELVEIVAISGVKLMVVPSDNTLSTIGRNADINKLN